MVLLVNIYLDHLCRLFCIAFAYADIVLYRPICVFCSVAVFLLANIRDSCTSFGGVFRQLSVEILILLSWIDFVSILVRIGSCCHGSSRQFE